MLLAGRYGHGGHPSFHTGERSRGEGSAGMQKADFSLPYHVSILTPR